MLQPNDRNDPNDQPTGEHRARGTQTTGRLAPDGDGARPWPPSAGDAVQVQFTPGGPTTNGYRVEAIDPTGTRFTLQHQSDPTDCPSVRLEQLSPCDPS